MSFGNKMLESQCTGSRHVQLTHVSVSIDVSPFKTSLGTELLDRDQNQTLTSVEVRSMAYLFASSIKLSIC